MLTVEGGHEVLLAPDGHRLGVARVEAPATIEATGSVAWAVQEQGGGAFLLGSDAAHVEPRESLFGSPGASALVGRSDALHLHGDLAAIVVWRATDRVVASRIIPPSAVVEEDRGAGAHARRVRTYLAEGPLIAGETLNPAGGWSSYPPHRHEHEEVYVYRFDPPDGFGVAVNYEDATDDTARVVRNGAVQRIASGYHPVVAAPGYAMYYLWALAGESDLLVPELDPTHAWAG